ncbi:MAG: hypothetical protein WD768_03515 [Phycisphaeraceae bacterium]
MMNRLANRRIVTVAALLLPACGMSIANAQVQPPTFTEGKLVFTCREYDARAKHDFTKRPHDATYEIKLSGSITIPKEMDVVCVTEDCQAKSVIDARKISLLKPVLRPVVPNRARDSFNAVVGGVAMVAMDKLECAAHPYLVSKMTIEAWALLAKERKEATVPAKVAEDASDIGYGMKVRLSAMKISNQRDVELTMEILRPEGTGGTILESVIALDEKGKELGGGRWGRGLRIFEGRGRFQAEFQIPPGSNIHNFKCIMVTKHELKAITFTLDGIFQK